MTRVYFTGRRKIYPRDVSITVGDGEPPHFSATADLSSHRAKLPDDARVVLECFDSFRMTRFDMGTVADCRLRDEPVLHGFREHDRPRFRLRVVEPAEAGAILAACDNVQARHPADDDDEHGQSILPIVWKPDEEMRGELWRLQSGGASGHELWLNRTPELFRLSAQNGELAALVHGTIVPAALRELFRFEFRHVEHGEIDASWAAFARAFHHDEPPRMNDEDEEREEYDAAIDDWIDRVIQGFCRRQGRFVERIEALSVHPEPVS